MGHRKVWNPVEKRWDVDPEPYLSSAQVAVPPRLGKSERRFAAALLVVIAGIILVSLIVGGGENKAQVPAGDGPAPSIAPPSATISPEVLQAEAEEHLSIILEAKDSAAAQAALEEFRAEHPDCLVGNGLYTAASARALGAELDAAIENLQRTAPRGEPTFGTAVAGTRRQGYVGIVLGASCD